MMVPNQRQSICLQCIDDPSKTQIADDRRLRTVVGRVRNLYDDSPGVG